MSERFEQFIRERQFLLNVSPRTIQWYREAFKWLNDEQPSQQALKMFVIRMREKGLKASSCNNRIRAINAYLNWAELNLQVPKLKEEQRVLPTFSVDARIRFSEIHCGRISCLTHMPPQTVIDLVDAFERNLESYRSPQYKEAEVRREFIDPFFDLLGWDVQNLRKYAENYKDVVHEPSLEDESGSTAPDYSFQPGGQLKFYVEAKKPSINLDKDPAPAHQVRMYGWTKQLPVSILTNFTEFAVYDCRFEPLPSDSPTVARVLYLTFREYVEKWDELVALFSPQAVFKGSFDKFVETRKRRGAAPFDERFLDDMEDWRKRLAENLALRNPELSKI